MDSKTKVIFTHLTKKPVGLCNTVFGPLPVGPIVSSLKMRMHNKEGLDVSVIIEGYSSIGDNIELCHEVGKALLGVKKFR